MFEAEADGLSEIARTRTVRVPMPLYGSDAQHAWLVMEWLPLSSDGLGRTPVRSSPSTWLQCTEPPRIDSGWTRDNTIGSTPQPYARRSGSISGAASPASSVRSRG